MRVPKVRHGLPLLPRGTVVKAEATAITTTRSCSTSSRRPTREARSRQAQSATPCSATTRKCETKPVFQHWRSTRSYSTRWPNTRAASLLRARGCAGGSERRCGHRAVASLSGPDEHSAVARTERRYPGRVCGSDGAGREDLGQRGPAAQPGGAVDGLTTQAGHGQDVRRKGAA